MISLYRARIALLLALLFAAGVLAFEVPYSELFHERGAIASASSTLRAEQQKNRSLKADISALKRPSTIGVIAHEDYGLVKAGERSVVVLPGAGEKTSSGLSAPELSPSDLVSSPASSIGPQKRAENHGPDFLRRVLTRLQFWRSL